MLKHITKVSFFIGFQATAATMLIISKFSQTL